VRLMTPTWSPNGFRWVFFLRGFRTRIVRDNLQVQDASPSLWRSPLSSMGR
jgi:hypothetical protein